jgi:16S rRNA (cytosine967-C5)-methyltransferase
MQAGARIQSAIEVLDEVLHRHRPAAEALSDWGRASRFAGSGDRAAVGNLVYDALRRKQSIAARMGSDAARALVLGAAGQALGLSPAAIVTAAEAGRHAVSALTDAEKEGLSRAIPADAPGWVQADVPGWLWASLQQVFGARAVEEGAALARRAPVDIRANTLKATRERVMKALSALKPAPTQFSPVGIRFAAPSGPGRPPNVEAEPAHGKGWFEVQDEGSQVAALIAGAAPRLQVLDLCAGAGGKTLALAARMENTGQIYAFDRDKLRLLPIFERLKRAGVRNVQIMQPGDLSTLQTFSNRFDLVLIDAPCTGTGVWRRRPDAKWRLKPRDIELRQSEQRALLEGAAPMVKPGGRLVYVTCSVLPQENEDQVSWFRGAHPEFAPVAGSDAWKAAGLGGSPPSSANGRTESLLLTPASCGTDGFFICVLRRAEAIEALPERLQPRALALSVNN